MSRMMAIDGALVVVVVVDAAEDATETGVFSPVLVRDVVQDAEREVGERFPRDEVVFVGGKAMWSGPRGWHTLKGG